MNGTQPKLQPRTNHNFRVASDIRTRPIGKPNFPLHYWKLLQYFAQFCEIHPSIIHNNVCVFDEEIIAFNCEIRAQKEQLKEKHHCFFDGARVLRRRLSLLSGRGGGSSKKLKA